MAYTQDVLSQIPIKEGEDSGEQVCGDGTLVISDLLGCVRFWPIRRSIDKRPVLGKPCNYYQFAGLLIKINRDWLFKSDKRGIYPLLSDALMRLTSQPVMRFLSLCVDTG